MITQPVNASDGELEGFELGFQYFPSNLPGILNGLGIVGSYTSLDSSQNIPQTDPEGNIIGQETTEFFQVSDSSYNVTLAYEHSGVGMRLSYVWREKFLNNNESSCLRESHRHLATPGEQSRLPVQLGCHRQLLGVIRRGEHHAGYAAVVLPLRRRGHAHADQLRHDLDQSTVRDRRALEPVMI